MIVPRQRISALLINIVGKANEVEDPGGRFSFSVRAQYRGASGRHYDHTFPIDFKHLVGSRTLGKPPLHAIAGSLEEIQKALSTLGTTSHRLEVVAYGPDDVKRELDEELADLTAEPVVGRNDQEPTAEPRHCSMAPRAAQVGRQPSHVSRCGRETRRPR